METDDKPRIDEQYTIIRRRLPSVHYVIMLITITCGLAMLHRCHLAYLFESDRHFSHLSTLERELTFRTEMGLYYSYYKTLVEAPSISSGIALVMNDNRTEYPSTINTLSRFNLYPELLISVGYRGFMSMMSLFGLPTVQCWRVDRGYGREAVVSCEGPGEPVYFYVESAFFLNGVLVGVMFLFGTYLSGTMFGGMLSSLSFFYNHRECTRVQWTPPLRESFAYPFFLCHVFIVMSLFRPVIKHLISSEGSNSNTATHQDLGDKSHIPSSNRCRISTCIHYNTSNFDWMKVFLVALSEVCFMLSWQFAQFALLMITLSVFVLYSCGLMDRSSLFLISVGQLIGFIISFCLLFGNQMLLTSHFFAAILLCLIMSVTRENVTCILWKYRLLTSICHVVVLAVGMLIVKFSLSRLLSVEDDTHIVDLLRSKFSSFQNFHTMLYTCAAEFDFLPLETITTVSKTCLFPSVLLIVMAIVVQVLKSENQILGKSPSNIVTSSNVNASDNYHGDDAEIELIAKESGPMESEEISADGSLSTLNKFTFSNSTLNDDQNVLRHRRIHEATDEKNSIDESRSFNYDDKVHRTLSPDKCATESNILSEQIKYTNKRDCFCNSQHHTLSAMEENDRFSCMLCFLALLLGAFTMMAGMFMRLKLFWTPHLCLMSSLLTSRRLFCRWLKTKEHVALTLIIVSLMSIEGIKNVQSEWEVMGEFNNMEMEEFIVWVDKSTPPDAVFAGPMSTMATVRLCTDRRVVNHPHYEDAELHHRTLEVYSLFSRKSAREVWEIMRRLRVDYAVLERVWCYGRSREGCAMVDLWDVQDPGNHDGPMTCELLMKDPSPYFSRVFRNSAFDVLQINYDAEL